MCQQPEQARNTLPKSRGAEAADWLVASGPTTSGQTAEAATLPPTELRDRKSALLSH